MAREHGKGRRPDCVCGQQVPSLRQRKPPCSRFQCGAFDDQVSLSKFWLMRLMLIRCATAIIPPRHGIFDRAQSCGGDYQAVEALNLQVCTTITTARSSKAEVEQTNPIESEIQDFSMRAVALGLAISYTLQFCCLPKQFATA